ncbi:alpha/beta fold hydrolase [Nocardia sp. NPDC004068]|uniref:alpha/beta fold hydrolase n=1 Tax=Nocardia sp. NPDC004068 TaxID=3364303 RepID=UPI00367FC08C
MVGVAPGELVVPLTDITVSALTWGERGAPLALCLHGYPDTAWSWRYLGPALAERGYYAVAPFSRGYAPSTIPADGDLSVGSRVADALDLTEKLCAPSAVVIGHDWGAFTATAIAAMPESPFRAVVSLAVPPLATLTPTRDRLVPHLLNTLAQSINSWYILANQVPAVPERLFTPMTEFLWRTWSPGYDAREDLAHLAESAPTPAHRTAIVDYYRQLVRRGPRSARSRELDRFLMAPPRSPILQLYGTTDGCLRPGLFDTVADRLPDGSVVVAVEGAGHFLHLECPDTVNGLILDYLG